MKTLLIIILCVIGSGFLVANPARLAVGVAKEGAEFVTGRALVRESAEQAGKIAASKAATASAVAHESDIISRIGEQVTPGRIITTGAATGIVFLADGCGDSLIASAEKAPEAFAYNAASIVKTLGIFVVMATLVLLLLSAITYLYFKERKNKI